MAKQNFWKLIGEYPPPQVRLFAKTPGGGRTASAISDEELAIATGITLARIREINYSPTWDGVTLSEMKAYFVACNFDPTNSVHRRRVEQYYHVCMNRQTRPFLYLRRHPKWESQFLPLVKLLKAMESQKNSSSESSPSSSHGSRSAA